MDEKLENIDIEKHKELFEYEMTEVIINLKGMFAHFNGENTEFAKNAVPEEKLMINLPETKKVEMEEVKVQTPVITPIDAINNTQVSYTKTQITLPQLPQLSDDHLASLKPVIETQDIHIEVPAIPSTNELVKENSDLVNVNTNLVNVPEIKSIKDSLHLQNQEMDIQVSSKVELPKIQTIQITQTSNEVFQSAKVDVPLVTKPASVNNCEVTQKKIQIEVPEIKTASLIKANQDALVQLEKIEIPAVADVSSNHEMIKTENKPIQVNDLKEIKMPEIKKVEIKNQDTVDLQLHTIEVPEVKKVEIKNQDTVNLQLQSIEIPAITKVNEGKELKVDIKQSTINIPKVKQVNVQVQTAPAYTQDAFKSIQVAEITKMSHIQSVQCDLVPVQIKVPDTSIPQIGHKTDLIDASKKAYQEALEYAYSIPVPDFKNMKINLASIQLDHHKIEVPDTDLSDLKDF